jgi:hypothetical protein
MKTHCAEQRVPVIEWCSECNDPANIRECLLSILKHYSGCEGLDILINLYYRDIAQLGFLNTTALVVYRFTNTIVKGTSIDIPCPTCWTSDIAYAERLGTLNVCNGGRWAIMKTNIVARDARCVVDTRMDGVDVCNPHECMIVLAPGTYEIEVHRVQELEI